jgi:ring-1,2-phenylacetyl-CoA epoxidase subunit PaaE
VQTGGKFSEFAANELAVGDQLDVMPPFGQFHASPEASGDKLYLGFAAGSGITPILSIIAALLRDEPASRFALFYGNRQQSTTMFIDDLYALKNIYPDRLQLQFVFSQEDQEFAIGAGRLDHDKVRELYEAFCRGAHPDEAFICGPDTMIEIVSAALIELGMGKSSVHAERFGVPRGRKAKVAPAPASGVEHTKVTVILDGHKKTFEMALGDANIVDAAAGHGIDLPFSCKGGVCATCRCHVREGEVVMATNYGLEPWELEKGFVLACQSRPTSKTLILDYDKT